MAKKTKKVVKKVKPLTKTEQERVAVLKDAIAQLRASTYLPAQGGYVSLKGSEPDWEGVLLAQEALDSVGIKMDLGKMQVQKILPNLIGKGKPCTVCAKGALAISAIKKFNNVSVSEMVDACSLDDISSGKAQEFFGEENADRMERYYENWDDRGEITDEEAESIKKWRVTYGYKTDESLIAIYTNAIKNRGIFKPL